MRVGERESKSVLLARIVPALELCEEEKQTEKQRALVERKTERERERGRKGERYRTRDRDRDGVEWEIRKT